MKTVEVNAFLVFLGYFTSRWNQKWIPTREGDNGVLYLVGAGIVPTLFRTRSAARAAIHRSHRFSDEHGLEWRSRYTYRIQKVSGEARKIRGD